MQKRIYFLAGLPRSGSTLLANILLQNPAIHVTSTSGIVDMLVQVRNAWDRNDAFRASDRAQSDAAKEDVLRGMLDAYFSRVERPVCIDKNRYWPEFLEMASGIMGGRERVKVIVSVRDLREVLASFEEVYRKTSVFGEVQTDPAVSLKFKTALGRVDVFLDAAQVVGRSYIGIRDALTRGWASSMHFVDYEDLTRQPKQTLSGIYRFLGEAPHEHDFERIEQLTYEDDLVHGFKDLHKIRPQVKPQASKWSRVFDDSVFQGATWKQVESAATFWKTPRNKPKPPAT
jgi:sulfotransferase